MAPVKKKKNSVGTKSTSKQVISDKKPLKKGKMTGTAAESTSEQVISDEQEVENKESGDVEGPSSVPVVKKPCTWLKLDKLDPQPESKSLDENFKQGTEGNSTSEVQTKTANKRRRLVKGIKALNKEPNMDEKCDKEKIIEDNKGDDVVGTPSTPAVKKPCTWLKLDKLTPQTESKSIVQNSEQGIEANPTSPVQTNNDGTRKRGRRGKRRNLNEPNLDDKRNNSLHEKKEKGNERHVDSKKRNDRSEKTLGGLVFMCNAKTKPDCLHFQVLGVPANKKEVVMGIKPGLKLFLYDYDLRVMYGIYKASSSGGMKLEPAAFGGGFPAQVRFTVHEDCVPLPEKIFKKALKDSYNERTHKFNTELTMREVKHLTDLFRPAPKSKPSGRSFVHEHNPIINQMPPTTLLRHDSTDQQRYLNNYGVNDPYHVSPRAVPSSQGQLFLTEQEYRSYGLQQSRHNNVGQTYQEQEPLPRNADYRVERRQTYQEQESLPGNTNYHVERRQTYQEQELLPRSHSSMLPRETPREKTTQPNLNFISEKDYRMYGLKGPQQLQSSVAPTVKDSSINPYNPYNESTDSLINRYLPLPRSTMAAETYPPAQRDHYNYDSNHTSSVMSQPRNAIHDYGRPSYTLNDQSSLTQRPYSLHASIEPSDINNRVYLQHETNLISAPVSHRYSFASGPFLSQQR